MEHTDLILVGKSKEHLILLAGENKWIHKKSKTYFESLKASAKRAGFHLRIASAFRDFETQLRIWNEKATGKRKVLSRDEKEIDIQSLPDKEKVYAILNWSQLPGASRHHWGTDIDVYDEKACPLGYQVQLTKEETDKGGIFFRFHEWLDTELEKHFFFRPYSHDLGGVQPERWHLSFAPLAHDFLSKYSIGLLHDTLKSSPIELKATILKELPQIYHKFIANISVPSSFLTQTQI